MEQVTRTIYGSALQTAMLLGLPHVAPEFSTLNKRFGVQADAVLADTEYTRMTLMCYGNGGHKLVTGADSVPYTKIQQHEPQDAAPFKPLPWVLRPTSSDLTPQERAKYAMRTVVTYNAETYFAYYLKRLNLAGVTVRMQKRNVQDGNTTSVDFVPTADNLVPTPNELANSGANALLADYLTVSALLSVTLTEADCEEILNVSRIIYGDDNYAIISEIGLTAGADKVIGLNDNSNFRESVVSQVISFIGAFHQVKYTSSGITGLFDVGTNEPLFTQG